MTHCYWAMQPLSAMNTIEIMDDIIVDLMETTSAISW